ncbi:TetR/AcrR family transcriptional regulator [Nocardioides sp. LHG3406-4]|uniref:TetR/AcrR family transcriptional regulator n=1 Tax=Nocardioides sp. LHG3406-4 TaxID=2804575 RepID=UPI003CF7A0BB
MARRKDQQARRDHFIAAARRRIVEQGLAPVRLRHIADEAGLSPGLVTYYFPDLDELFREVYSDAVDRFYVQRRAMIEGTSDPRERLLAMIRSGLPTGPDDEICALLSEFGPQVGRSPVVKALRKTLFERQVMLYESILTTGAALGVFDLTSPALTIASNLVALEDAYGHHVIAEVSVGRDDAERFLIGYASATTGCDLS